MDVERNPGPILPIHYKDFSLSGNFWNSSNYATSTGSYNTSDPGDFFINRHLNTCYNFRYFDHLTVPYARNLLTFARVELDVALKVNLPTELGLFKLWRVVQRFPLWLKIAYLCKLGVANSKLRAARV